MPVLERWWLFCCALLLAAAPLAAQEYLTYRDRTGGQEITIHVEEERLPQGLVFRSFLSNGDYHEVDYDSSETTVRYRVASPERKTDYTASRAGDVIQIQGLLGGKPVSRRLRIDQRPWLETLEVSLSRLAVSSAPGPFLFWIVHPWEARAYLLQAKTEPEESITVADTLERAIPVRVAATGLLALFWSVRYWYRPSDGLFIRYEGVRGLPGTPLTVVELLSEH